MSDNLREFNPEELELVALATLRKPADVRYAREAGVDEFSFQVDEHVRAWEYLVKRAERSDEPASVEDVLVFAGVALPEGLTDREAAVEALVELSVARRARAAALRHLDGLTSPTSSVSPKQAVSALVAELSELSAASSRGHARYFDRDARERLAEVFRRTEAAEEGGLSGWPTGIKLFDEAGEGWQPGELVVFMGMLNVGKSWLALKSAAHSYWYGGAKVLYLSPESSVFDVETRLDSVVARELGMQVGNRALRRGRVPRDTYQRYIDALLETGRAGWVTLDAGSAGSFQVPDIISAAREHRPDVLVIDGFHLISGTGKTWESMKDSAEAVKGLAQALNLSVLAVHQANREAVLAPDDAPRLGDSAYGLALVQAANRVISLAHRRGYPQQRVFKVVKNRDGEVPTDSFYLRWNPEVGDIQQVDPNVDEESGFVDFGD